MTDSQRTDRRKRQHGGATAVSGIPVIRIKRRGTTRWRGRARMGGLVAPILLLACALAAAPALAQTPAWMDTSRDSGWRAQQLLSAMTLDEKLAMVHGGALAAGAGAGTVPGNTRLGIPALYLSDGPLGVANAATGVTQWPDATNNAATWDPALVNQLGQAMGAEFAGKGRNVALSPTVNILRVPFWGRAFETFSEDPFLTSAMGVSEIDGIQSQHVIATVKHFAANNQEVQRDGINANVSDQALHEIYFPAFEAAVEDAHVGSVMCSYNRLNGDYACENGDLLTTALRTLWHFAGFVVSDWGATHSTARAANAGLDLEMPGAADGSSFFGSALKDAVTSGQVPLTRLDGMVTNLLTAMFQVGLFDHPLVSPASAINTNVSTAEHQQLATRLSEEGTVLLKNRGGQLPLADAPAKTIAVVGYAGDAGAQYAGGGSANVFPSGTPVSPLAAITQRASGHVSYAKGPGGPLPVLPASRVTPAGAGTSGFTGTYYSSADFSGTPLAVRNDPTLDFGTGQLAEYSLPVAGAQSVRWQGTLQVNTTGTYHFSTQSTGTVTVYVNGRQVLTATSGVTSALGEGSVQLTAGQPASIRVDYQPFSVPSFNVLFSHLVLGARTPDDPDPIAAAAQAAKDADTAIVFASDFTTEGADRTSLALPGDENALIQAVADANPHTVVVLNTSSAVTMPWLDKVSAVLESWYPGQQYGTALASLLFGDTNPSGKLPLTFPASDQQGPWGAGTLQYPGDGTNVFYSEGIDVGYRWYDASTPGPCSRSATGSPTPASRSQSRRSDRASKAQPTCRSTSPTPARVPAPMSPRSTSAPDPPFPASNKPSARCAASTASRSSQARPSTRRSPSTPAPSNTGTAPVRTGPPTTGSGRSGSATPPPTFPLPATTARLASTRPDRRRRRHRAGQPATQPGRGRVIRDVRTRRRQDVHGTYDVRRAERRGQRDARSWASSGPVYR